jgi:hypothetical protein
MLAAAAITGGLAAAPGAGAQPPVPAAEASTQASGAGAAPVAPAVRDCAAWDATYKITGTLRITETAMGAGDGSHPVGPGTLVLRFIADDPAQPPRVELRSFELHEHFSVEPKGAFWSATVVTDALARATPDGDGVVARGTVAPAAGTGGAPTLRWDGPIPTYRSDGAVNCTGSLCGNFGAPPPGRSPTRTATHAVKFEPLRFGASGLTFEMLGYSVVSQDQSPHQKTMLAVSGRAASWVCTRPRSAETGEVGR